MKSGIASPWTPPSNRHSWSPGSSSWSSGSRDPAAPALRRLARRNNHKRSPSKTCHQQLVEMWRFKKKRERWMFWKGGYFWGDRLIVVFILFEHGYMMLYWYAYGDEKSSFRTVDECPLINPQKWWYYGDWMRCYGSMDENWCSLWPVQNEEI